MPDILTADVIGFFIVFARVGAMLSLLPGLGDESLPVRFRLMLGLLLTVLIYPTVFLQLPPNPKSLEALAAVLGKEILIGLIIGGAVRILMQALHVAGTVIANQVGLATAMLFDPSMGGQATVVTKFLGLIGVLMIFATNTHHIMIAGMARSYALFSPTAPMLTADFAQWTILLVSQSFALGIQLAAPFLVFAIIFNVGLGLITRLTPTVQAFFIAQPLSIMLALALLMSLLGTMMTVFISRFQQALGPLLGGS
jgi:flagellar biosynthesis protein FliR